MDHASLKANIRENLDFALKAYLQDIDATPHELLAAKHGKADRNAYDFNYELSFFNNRAISRLRGEQPPPWPSGLIVAPEEYRDKQSARDLFAQSSSQFMAEWDARDPSRLWEEIPTAANPTSAGDLALFITNHVSYHDGQLNLIQAIAGDNEIHWDEH